MTPHDSTEIPPDITDILRESQVQAGLATELRAWNDLLDRLEALPKKAALILLNAGLDAADAYSGPLAKAARKLAESALKRVAEKTD